MSQQQIEALVKWIQECEYPVFFGGAGVSTESHIPDFRSTDGLYHQKYKESPETILSHTYFMRKTKDFYAFYRDKMLFSDAMPNPAHLALAALERMGKMQAVITQNIDGLHQKAGSKEVLELHGSVHRNYCMKCHAFYDLSYMLDGEGIPECSRCGGTIKPDVVLYEEGLDDSIWERSIQHLLKADLLIVGGTSLVVYPAAGLLRYFRGKHLVLINKSATAMDIKADLVITEPIGETMKQVMNQLLKERKNEKDSF